MPTDTDARVASLTRFISKCKSRRAKTTNTSTKWEEDVDPCRMRQWTERLPLGRYADLRHVPKIVNVVSLCTLRPVRGTTLPLDLFQITKKCKGAMRYAPDKFAPAQVGFGNPRSRVLIFRTSHT